MAIYNVNNIMNEQESYNETSIGNTDEVLDNMLEACEYMLGTLASIDEGAYHKYMSIQADKQDAYQKRADKFEDLSNKLTGEAAKKAAESAKYNSNKAYNIWKKEADKKYIYCTVNKSGNSIRDNISTPHGSEFNYLNYRSAAKRNWERDHGNSGEDKIGNRKPGTFASKKKAIKETCLTILSALDDIED